MQKGNNIIYNYVYIVIELYPILCLILRLSVSELPLCWYCCRYLGLGTDKERSQ